MSDRDLYSRLLLAKGKGYPLSCPQPSDDLPPACRERGIEIGDVGILTSDGSFDVFFNICRARDDPVNRFGLPPGFKPVRLASGDLVSRESYYRPGSHVSNSTMKKRRLDVNTELDNVFLPLGAEAVIEVSTVSKQTAVLLLPDGASRLDLRFLNKFRQVALKHAKNWYAFVIGLGSMLENDELYLVTGVDKSASWAVAAAESRSEDYNINLKLRATQVASVAGSYAWQWESGNEFADLGPRRPPGEPSSVRNQTVFLRGFRIAVHSLVWRKIAQAVPVGHAKPTTFLSRRWFASFIQSATTDEASSHNGVESIQSDDREPILSHSSSGSRPYHPADAICQKLLSSPWWDSDSMPPNITGSDAVVIHDNEWMSLLKKDGEVVPSNPELLGQVLTRYKIIRTSLGAYLQDRDENAEEPGAFSLQMSWFLVIIYRTEISLAIAIVLLWYAYTVWPARPPAAVVDYFRATSDDQYFHYHDSDDAASGRKTVTDHLTGSLSSFGVFIVLYFAISITQQLLRRNGRLEIDSAQYIDVTALEQQVATNQIDVGSYLYGTRPTYGVSPRRPRRIPMTCEFCRSRRLKCDGLKPQCSNCNRRQYPCNYVPVAAQGPSELRPPAAFGGGRNP